MPESSEHSTAEESQKTPLNIQEVRNDFLFLRLLDQEKLEGKLADLQKELQTAEKEFFTAKTELDALLYPEDEFAKKSTELNESLAVYDNLMVNLENKQIEGAIIETKIAKIDKSLDKLLEEDGNDETVKYLIKKRESLFNKFLENKDNQFYLESEASELKNDIEKQIQSESISASSESNTVNEKELDEKLQNFTDLAEVLAFLRTEIKEQEESIEEFNRLVPTSITGRAYENTVTPQESENFNRSNNVANDNSPENTRALLNELLDRQDVPEQLINEILKANNTENVKKNNDSESSQSEDNSIASTSTIGQGSKPDSETQQQINFDLSMLSRHSSSKSTNEKNRRKTVNPALKTASRRRMSI